MNRNIASANMCRCTFSKVYIVAWTLSECFLQSGCPHNWGIQHCLLSHCVIIKFPLIKRQWTSNLAEEFGHSNHDYCNRYEVNPGKAKPAQGSNRTLFAVVIIVCLTSLLTLKKKPDHWRYKSAFYEWRLNYYVSGLFCLWNKLSHAKIMCREHASLLSPSARPAAEKWFFMQR